MITQQLIDWGVQGALFLLLFVITYLVWKPKPRRKGKARWRFVSTNAMLLTVFTAGCSGNYPLLMESQKELFGILHEIRGWLDQRPIEGVMGLNRFLLINVSHDLDLIADQSVNPGWEGRQIITDRRKLTRFLQLVSQDSLGKYVDAVVCDLTFGEPSDSIKQDVALEQAVKVLNSQKKLLIAKSALDENADVYGNSVIDTDSLEGGSVDVITYSGGTFFAHQLFNSESLAKNSCLLKSLPYALFTHLEKLDSKPLLGKRGTFGFWESSENNWAWASGRFIPEYWVDDDDINRDVRESWWDYLTKTVWKENDSTDLFKDSGKLRPYLYHLGELTDVTDTNGVTAFRNALLENRQHGCKSIVFIGLFTGSERDIHQTVVGSMRGSIIILNVFLNLINGSHHISFLYLLYLFVGFGCVSLLQLKTYFRFSHFAQRGKKSTRHWWSALIQVMKKLVNSMISFINENQPYLFSVLILIGSILIFNHLINIVAVEIYLVCTNWLLDELDPVKHR